MPIEPFVQKTIAPPSGNNPRPLTEMTGQKVTMYNKRTGEAKEVERNLSPSFEKAYSFTNPNAASTNADNNVTDGSGGIRDGIKDNQNEAIDLKNKLNAGGDFDSSISEFSDIYSMVDLNENMADIDALRADIASGNFTDDQRNSITNAGDLAAGVYDSDIADSVEAARKGKPKAYAAGGAAGGFMNTQFAGKAALADEGTGSFAGTGGILENINSSYDRNINNLKSKQTMARQAAEQAAEQAILTGKRSDLSFLKDMYEAAVKAKELEVTLQNEKMQAITNYEKQEQVRVETNLQNASQAMIGALTGDKAQDSEILANLALQYGVDENQLNSYVKNFQLAQGKEMFDVAKNLDTDQTYTMPDGTVITGTNKTAGGGYETTFQTAGGQNMMITYDGEGNIIKQNNLGSAYKEGGSGSGSGASDADINKVQDIFSQVIGDDGFVSPKDYKELRVIWIQEQKDPTEFDKEFSGFRNPNNQGYGTEKYEKEVV